MKIVKEINKNVAFLGRQGGKPLRYIYYPKRNKIRHLREGREGGKPLRYICGSVYPVRYIGYPVYPVYRCDIGHN